MMIALNTGLVNKPSKDDLGKYSGSFFNADLNAQQLAAHVNSGYAFCSQLEGRKRSSAAFKTMGFLAVDIDHGLTLETALTDDFVKKYGSVVYTTVNHTADHNRFRMVFELQHAMTHSEDVTHALTGLIARFGGDKSCSDAARLFYGSKGCQPLVLRNVLPPEAVQELIALGKEARGRQTRMSEDEGVVNTVRSRNNIPASMTVRAASGEYGTLREFPSRTRIYCPQHADTRPSAFTLRSETGTPGFFCSSCAATFFVADGTHGQHKYRFDYDWSGFQHVSVEEHFLHADENDYVDLQVLRSLKVVHDRYLPYNECTPTIVTGPGRSDNVLGQTPGLDANTGLNVASKLTYIKSPKGTGKTEWLKRLVADYVAAGVSVLLIGHRRALIYATAQRIGLTYYRGKVLTHVDGTKSQHPPEATKHFSICVDSLPKLDTLTQKFDVIIVDEVEQVFGHLLASTLKEQRRPALIHFSHYIEQAKAVYMLDADLDIVAIEVAMSMHKSDVPSWRAIYNAWKPSGGHIELYDTRDHSEIVGELAASLARGERCFVCSNSKKLIKEISAQIEKDSKRPLKSLVITSDNSQDLDIQELVADISARATEFDVIYASPSLGTGIDITFPDGAQLIDTVFGIFKANVNTHFDIDQQLCRVRNPKRISVWISAEKFNFETDAEVIKAELRATEGHHLELLRIEPSGKKVYFEDDLYELIYSLYTARDRASKNNLRQNFIDLRAINGWDVRIVGGDAAAADLGGRITKHGKAHRLAQEYDRQLNAPRLSPDQYFQLRKLERQEMGNPADKSALRRYEIESFYRTPISLDLLEIDREQRFREAIKAYTNLVADPKSLADRDLYAEDDFTTDKPAYLIKQELATDLLKAAGIFEDGGFKPEVEMTAESLKAFAALTRSNKASIERLFGVSVRKDVFYNPVQQLRVFLKIFGLKVRKTGRDQSGDKSTSFYSVCNKSLHEVQSWVELRANEAHRDRWVAERTPVPPEPDRPGLWVGPPCKPVDPLDRR